LKGEIGVKVKEVFFFLFLSISAVLIPGLYPAQAAEKLSAREIIEKSENVYPGMDQQSKLTFIIKEPGGDERKVILRRFWKNYPKDPEIDSKVLVFHIYPPDTRGTAFMVWTYKSSTGRPEDMWIYLPLLRKVQKLPQHPDEIFSGSNLKPADMIPRDPDLDTHRLLREETINNQEYYVIESVPKKHDPNYNYSKVIKWINKKNFLKERVDYYDMDGSLLKTQLITWKKVKNAYVWEKVVITNVKTGVQTILYISDIKVDTGLKDRLFTLRTMARGIR